MTQRNSTLRRAGFTLVELLVVIAIIGILIALLMPAIQSAREAGRRTVCLNHLKQISLSALNHQGAMKTFPAGGWGYLWIGDPDQGSGRKQPGSWIYNILPFIEEKNLHDLGAGMVPQSADKKKAAAQMLQTPLEAFICPTRRPVQAFEAQVGDAHIRMPNYSDPVTVVARTDYSGNAGTVYNDPSPYSGPSSLADFASSNWNDRFNTTYDTGNGIFSAGNAMKLSAIRDGLSKTYLFGEKRLNPSFYLNGVASNDNESMYTGGNEDNHAWGKTSFYPPGPDSTTDEAGNILGPSDDTKCFGSAHPATFGMSFCDGSVHTIPFHVDPKIHEALANRKDGLQVSTSSFE